MLCTMIHILNEAINLIAIINRIGKIAINPIRDKTTSKSRFSILFMNC